MAFGKLNLDHKFFKVSTYTEIYSDSTHSEITRYFGTLHSFETYQPQNQETGELYKGIRAGSYIKDPTILMSENVHVGMSKDEFFNKFFKNYNETLFKGTNQITVCGDMRGDDYTKYFFISDTLDKITFGDHMD